MMSVGYQTIKENRIIPENNCKYEWVIYQTLRRQKYIIMKLLTTEKNEKFSNTRQIKLTKNNIPLI